MVPIFAAFQFLTIFPAVIRRTFSAQELGRSTGWYPLVGLSLGGGLFGLDLVLNMFLPSQVSAVFVLAFWLIATRGLHFDGFLDSCDGLFGGFSAERRLEIMRDSRVGAFGVAGGVLLLLGKFVLIASLVNPMAGLLLAPVLGRWGLTMAIFLFTYARQDGLGKDIKDHTGWFQAVLASILSLSASWLIAGWMGLLGMAVAGLILWGGAAFILRRIPGLTGDSYGALCEVLELVILLFFVIADWSLA